MKCDYVNNQKINKPQMLHLESKNHHVCCLDEGVSETTSGEVMALKMFLEVGQGERLAGFHIPVAKGFSVNKLETFVI